ncbi:hypothetical protein GF322_04000 [Candidatus Dependentiae bacterium]|nr:hypothetical protein [Candidatus Dependentiae bacterium]
MKLKTVLRLIILLGLIGYFLQAILFGQRGFKKYLELKNEINFEKNKILKTKKKILDFEEKIAKWNENNFELERLAREELQMCYANEHVFIFK